MKTKLLTGLISIFSFLLFTTGHAQAPVADFALAQTTICAGSQVQITDLSTGTPNSWSYTLSGGSPASSPLQNPVTVYNSAGIYTITLVATNATGASAAISKTISVNALPSLTVSGTSSVCAGSTITHTVSGADTYTWSTGATSTVETFTPAVNTSYTVSGTNTLTTCWQSTTFTITVNALPVLSVSGGSAVCMGSSVSQTVSGADTYTWSESSTGSVVALSPTLASTYTVTGTNTLTGCANYTTVSISVNALPVLSITGGNTICAGSSITQTVSGADTYLWSNGSTTDATTLTPLSSGLFSVTGTSTLTGCSAPATVSITVIALPSLTLSGSSAFCSGGSVTQTVSGADSYLWSTGTTSDVETFSPATSTNYTVTGTHTLTGCSNSSVLAVTVNTLPVLSVSGNTAVCFGSSVSQTVSGASTYTWSEGSTGSVVAVSPTIASTYTITGTNAATGCFSSVTFSLAVNALPVVSITGGNTVCAGSAITQTASGADTYAWMGGSTSDVATFNPLASGLFSVTGTSTLTGCSASTSASITAIALPVLTLSGANAYCVGGSATQTVSGADTYSWSTGSLLDSETFNPATSTNYTVNGTNTLTGCSNAIQVPITVNAFPTITVNSGAICAGSVFTMNPGGAFTYTFSNGANTATPSSNTSYSVTGTSTAGCISSNTAVASVTVNALPTVTVNSGAICAGSVFTMTPGGASTYTFSNGSNTASPILNTTYSVTGTSIDGCVSSNTAVASVTVNALPSLTVAGTSTLCAGQSSTLTASGATTFTWNGSTISQTLGVTPAITTNYSVSGTDNNGCINLITQLVTVNILPTVTVNSGTICQGSSFVMVPGGAMSYTFSSGSANVTPNATTTYSVIGVSQNGCYAAQQAVSTVSVVNAFTLSVSGPVSICVGSPASFTASGAPNYTWNTGANTSTLTVTPASTTVYTVTGYNGPCSFSALVGVTVTPLPTVSITTSNAIICDGQPVTLSGLGATTYTWSTLQSSVSISVAPSVNTTYSVIGTDVNGCKNVASITQSVSACTGLASQEANSIEVNMYPNPNSGYFTLDLQQAATVTIMNQVGQLIYTSQLEAGSQQLDLKDQVNGLYFVTLKQGDYSKTLKMIKN